MKKYEKWIGYCFYDDITKKEVILENITTYSCGRNCYEMSEKQSDGTYIDYICDFAKFKQIWNGTTKP